MLTAERSAGGAAFELDRFEWGAERIEIEGRWLGIRGRRFVRPTLTLRGAHGERRALALLDHKPWDPGEEAWIAAFAWAGEPTGFDEAELAVAPGLEVLLPAPGQARSGDRRYAARAEPAARAGVDELTRVRDQLAAERATVERLEAKLDALRGEVADLTRARDAVAREGRVALDAETDEAERVRKATEAERDAAMRERDALQAELDMALRQRQVLQTERDAALAGRDAIRAERDKAISERDSLRLPASYVSLPRSSIYTSTASRSLLERWTPRLIAFFLILAFVLVVVLLFR